MRRAKGACRTDEGRGAARRRYSEGSPTQKAGMLPAILPFLFAVLWASSYAAAKIGLADISPYLFVAVRLGIAAVAAIVMVLALKRPLGPLKLRWPHLMIGGALVHGLALATAHEALVSVAATPTALVHAFHPILTAALGVVAAGREASPGGNGSASRSVLPVSCSACRTTRTSASWRCWA